MFSPGKTSSNGLKGKKILIRADGSHAIGLGHVYRMKALALALEEAEAHVAFLTHSDKEANHILLAVGLPCHAFQPSSYDATLKQTLEAQQPDLILQDILETSDESMTALRELSRTKIINFDDVGAGLTMAEAVINGLVFHWGRYKSDECTARLFEGPKYMILQKEIGPYVQLHKETAGSVKNVLLSFGGTDTHHLSEKVLEAMNCVKSPLGLKVHLGPGTRSTPSLEELVKASPHRVEIIRSPDNLFEEFYNADLVICGGGITLYELAALGVPSLSIATEDHEVYNTDYWSNIGTTTSLGSRETLDWDKISEIVHGLLFDKDRRLQMSRIGKQTIDHLGLTRVLKVIEEVLN